MAMILSGQGGIYAVPEDYRKVVCVLDDGQILVSKDKVNEPFIRSYIARVTKAMASDGVVANKREVDLQAIHDAYEQTEQTPGAQNSQDALIQASSQMQREALAMFADAVRLGASDIHIRIGEERAKILYRVNNDLRPIGEHPAGHAMALARSIYVSMTDVSDTVFKQSGRQDARIGDRKKLPPELHGLRISTSPSVDGMLMVLRLLYHSGSNPDIISLGYNNDHMSQVSMMMSRPYGINFVSGPTGSGKSTTLQRILARVSEVTAGRAHIITVEDPPEYPIAGAVQTPVVADTEEGRGEAFRAAIRSCMRLDPDVIMIGEIRDHESAQLAIDAAMTGHQVWTTIHANNAMAIYSRLVEIGIPLATLCDPTLITGLMAQRLVTKLCEHCKIPLKEAEDRKLIGRELSVRVHRACEEAVDHVYVRNSASDCPHCAGTGVTGRSVVSEIVIPDPTLCQLLADGDRNKAVHYWTREQRGMNMLQHCLSKIKLGLVDPADAESQVGPLTMDIIANDDKIYTSEIRETVDSLNQSSL